MRGFKHTEHLFFSAINNKVIEVTFNKEIDKATATAVTAKVLDGTTTVSAAPIVRTDNKSLVLPATGTLDQNKTYKVAVNQIKSKDGKEVISNVSKDVTVVDTTFPTVVNAVATTSKTIEVTFSEPVNISNEAKVWEEFALNGINLYATVSGATTTNYTSNKVILTLANKMNNGDKFVVTPKLKDFANFPVTQKEFTMSVTTDTTAPAIAGAKVLENTPGAPGSTKVEVKFNEPVQSATIATTSADFTFTPAGGSTIQIAGAGVANSSGDNATFELTLADDLGPAALVEVVISYKGVKDIEGNEVKTATQFKFQAEDDTVAPTVTAQLQTGNKVLLTFSEKVLNATTAANYELYDKDNKKVATTITPSVKSGDTTGTLYELSFSNATQLDGNYTLKVVKTNNISDLSVRNNKVAETNLPITFASISAPTIQGDVIAQVDKDFTSDTKQDAKIKIAFSKQMDSANTTNLANYMIKLSTADYKFGNLFTGATATLSTDGKSIDIVIPGSNTAQLDIDAVTNIAATDIKIKVLGVKDVNGNLLSSSDLNREITAIAFVSDAATLTSVEATAKRAIVIKSNVAITSIDPNAIKFVKSSGTDVAQTLGVASVSFSSDKKTATLTLNADIQADGNYNVAETGGPDVAALDMVFISDKAVVNALGQCVAYGVLTDSNTWNGVGSNYTIADKIGPSIITTDPVVKGSTDDTILVKFDEDIKTQFNGDVANDLTVKIDGVTLDNVKGEFTVATTANDDEFEITVKKPGVVDTNNVLVSLVSGRYLVDNSTARNRANTFTDVAIKTTDKITEKVAPTFTATGAGNTITVVFSEQVEKASAENIANYTYKADGTNTEAVVSAVLGADGKTVTITTTTAVTGATSTIDASVKDLAGNTSASAPVTL
ncbi:Ig-like domain-containing protein [Desulfoscipio gibsoniae]|uniref:Ig-like domain-containing protein n=1 Tax=Desulfoscipio gibsoniae TaxID=102134 RepID=UPI000318B3B4|nr:Ig-like domain-containing protein [Desulfoscipio gibsoniae]